MVSWIICFFKYISVIHISHMSTPNLIQFKSLLMSICLPILSKGPSQRSFGSFGWRTRWPHKTSLANFSKWNYHKMASCTWKQYHPPQRTNKYHLDYLTQMKFVSPRKIRHFFSVFHPTLAHWSHEPLQIYWEACGITPWWLPCEIAGKG